jgi:26S proteasome regulatory subunit N10
VLVTLTQDIGKILSALHSSKIMGNADIATGINVATVGSAVRVCQTCSC